LTIKPASAKISFVTIRDKNLTFCNKIGIIEELIEKSTTKFNYNEAGGYDESRTQKTAHDDV
jgi:hypothetical protein